jgi:phage/conjugal plasmid C-4 type zinc finger TraR family protein
MADDADRAQVHESAFLAASLSNAKPPPGPAPDIVDGVVCCAECGDPIAEARLKALPGVGLCVGCAE